MCPIQNDIEIRGAIYDIYSYSNPVAPLHFPFHFRPMPETFINIMGMGMEKILPPIPQVLGLFRNF